MKKSKPISKEPGKVDTGDALDVVRGAMKLAYAQERKRCLNILRDITDAGCTCQEYPNKICYYCKVWLEFKDKVRVD